MTKPSNKVCRNLLLRSPPPHLCIAAALSLSRAYKSRVRGARGEVEGELSEGGEGGAGTWRRSRIMEVDGRSGSQDGAHTAPYWGNGTALCALQCGHSATFAVVTEPKTCPQL